MTPRRFRSSLLLAAAFCWIASPAVVHAGPGGGHGASGGGHAGSGGGHASSGGGHAGSGGGHTGSYASGSIGHAPAPASGGHYAGSMYSGGAYRSGGGAPVGSFASTSFVSPSASGSGSADGRSAATNAALSQLASHGWNFAPSSGVTRAVAAPVRSGVHVPVSRGVPVVVPPRGPFPRRLPFATTVIVSPGFGFNRGGCINNGFTTVCGIGFGSFWGLGPWGGYCSFGWDCADGYGYYGGGYYPGPADQSMYYDEGPQNSGRMDIYGGYSPDALSQPSSVDDTAPAPPPTQIILKSGTSFAVRSYWVFNGELYYKPVTGGVSHVPLEQLDLAATVQANSRNGVSFNLSENPN